MRFVTAVFQTVAVLALSGHAAAFCALEYMNNDCCYSSFEACDDRQDGSNCEVQTICPPEIQAVCDADCCSLSKSIGIGCPK